jgi:UPF0288 family protein (methanogenesis marker protein 3)
MTWIFLSVKKALPHIISALKRLGIDKITGRKRGALTVFLKRYDIACGFVYTYRMERVEISRG